MGAYCTYHPWIDDTTPPKARSDHRDTDQRQSHTRYNHEKELGAHVPNTRKAHQLLCEACNKICQAKSSLNNDELYATAILNPQNHSSLLNISTEILLKVCCNMNNL